MQSTVQQMSVSSESTSASIKDCHVQEMGHSLHSLSASDCLTGKADVVIWESCSFDMSGPSVGNEPAEIAIPTAVCSGRNGQ